MILLYRIAVTGYNSHVKNIGVYESCISVTESAYLIWGMVFECAFLNKEKFQLIMPMPRASA